MIELFRKNFIQALWQEYLVTTPQAARMCDIFHDNNIQYFPLDHFAIIDLPSENSGIHALCKLLELIGFEIRGKDYLPEKQNDFAWLAETNVENLTTYNALPQIVIADFRLEEMPHNVRDIISRYANQTITIDYTLLQTLCEQMQHGDKAAYETLLTYYLTYFNGRDWSLPSVFEFETVREFNELLAWVLIFGRRPNHFTFAIHLMPEFNSLKHFNDFVMAQSPFTLNQEGGVIKGNEKSGIVQSSTMGNAEKVALADGEINLPHGFIEFAFRFSHKNMPKMWGDYFTGFVGENANKVIESLL